MDISAVMKEIDSWPEEKRFRLLEALWEKVGSYAPKLSKEDRQELDRRLDAYERNSDHVIPWEQVQAEAKRIG